MRITAVFLISAPTVRCKLLPPSLKVLASGSSEKSVVIHKTILLHISDGKIVKILYGSQIKMDRHTCRIYDVRKTHE